MTAYYKTKDRDMIDAICWTHYGQQAGAVETVLKANCGLAEWGSFLPAGLVIVLPDMPHATTKPTIKLWD